MTPPYPEYRAWPDSWLPQVPSHWKTGPLRHFINFETGWTPPTEDDTAYGGPHRWANISDLGPRTLVDTAKHLSAEAVGGRVPAPAGALLFSFKLSVGAVSRAGHNMFTNEAIATFCESKDVDLDYAYYAFPEFIPMNANTNIYGAKLLNGALIRQAPVALPPVEEQRAIADYLDRATSKLDILIEEQQRLIETLRERRRAVIETSVFGGVHGAPTTDNTEEWLPQTPNHWAVLQLGFVTDTLAGWAFPSSEFSHSTSDVRLLRGVNIKPGRIDWTEAVYWDAIDRPVPAEFSLRHGDLVIGMDRPFVSGGVRVAAVSDDDLPALLLQRVLRMRPGTRGDEDYFRYVVSTRAFLAYLEPLFTGVSVPHVSEWQVRKFKMPLPPLDEQRHIAAYLNEQTSKIDILIAETERFIELSKERRAALITAAVTGQIDVREVAA